MNKKRDIPVRKVVEDITGGQVTDRAIMSKYGLNHRAFIYILGNLAERRKISFKRVFFHIRKLIEEGNVKLAKSCLHVVEKYYGGVWAVQSMVKGLERELLETKNRLELKRDTGKVSKSLSWFNLEYPGVFIHPSVISSVKVFEKYPDKIICNGNEIVAHQDPFDARSRLRVYCEHIPSFEKYEPLEAVRMWHYISILLFARKGIRHFVIKGMMDAATCDVCMHLDGTRVTTHRVLALAGEPKKRGSVLPDKSFPSLISVEDLSMDEKEDALIRNGWFLPPFCEHCRCQVFPLS